MAANLPSRNIPRNTDSIISMETIQDGNIMVNFRSADQENTAGNPMTEYNAGRYYKQEDYDAIPSVGGVKTHPSTRSPIAPASVRRYRARIFDPAPAAGGGGGGDGGGGGGGGGAEGGNGALSPGALNALQQIANFEAAQAAAAAGGGGGGGGGIVPRTREAEAAYAQLRNTEGPHLLRAGLPRLANMYSVQFDHREGSLLFKVRCIRPGINLGIRSFNVPENSQMLALKNGMEQIIIPLMRNNPGLNLRFTEFIATYYPIAGRSFFVRVSAGGIITQYYFNQFRILPAQITQENPNPQDVNWTVYTYNGEQPVTSYAENDYEAGLGLPGTNTLTMYTVSSQEGGAAAAVGWGRGGGRGRKRTMKRKQKRTVKRLKQTKRHNKK